jgi:hypothetical protein
MAVIPPLCGCADGEDEPLALVQVSSPAPGLLAGVQTAPLLEAPIFCHEPIVDSFTFLP